MADKILEMQFDPNTIKHLGINTYSKLPPVLAELVSNCYDADAEKVIVHIYDNDPENKKIIIEDFGHGMTFDEINNKYLVIGRDRREEEGQMTQNGKRYAIGKKGIGKLSFFGIAKKATIKSFKDGIENEFELTWNGILEAGKRKEKYRPSIISYNKVIDDKDKKGTTITLSNFERKSPFPDAQHIAYNLSRNFQVFGDDFNVSILKNDTDQYTVKNEDRYKYIIPEFEWELPFNEEEKRNIESSSPRIKEILLKYEYADKISGKIIAATETVENDLRGVALFSRKKLVNDPEFYDNDATSFGYSYITGWLNIDFIDEFKDDLISTNRRSLNWEHEITDKLKVYLTCLVSHLHNERKKKVYNKKIKDLSDKTGVDLPEWIGKLPKHEAPLARKLIDNIINADGLTTEKATELTLYVYDFYKFESFKEIAHDLSLDGNLDSLLEIFKEWKFIEAREFYKLSNVRIEAIKSLEKHIEKNSLEVPVLHDFFAKFSWLLDPRIMNFDDEVTFSKLLKERFPEDDMPEEERRMDFLCQKFGDSFFIIELKRPKTVINNKIIQQAVRYISFMENEMKGKYGKNVHCYILGHKITTEPTANSIYDSLNKDGKVFIKPYTELLQEAINYHQEFIEKYDEISK